MRVAIFTETFLPKIDGVVAILCQALQQLAHRGHQVLVIGPPDMPAEYAGARCVPAGGPRFPAYPELRINLPSRRIIDAVRQFAPDVIHVVNPAFLGPTGIALARYLGTPLVASSHMDIPSYTRLYVGAWGVPIAWRLFAGVHNTADLNLVPSSAMLAQVRAHGYQRVRWWHRGIDADRFAPHRADPAMRQRLSGGHPDELLAVYVGRISREKQVHLLRDTVARLPGVRLALVGGGPELAAMQHHFAGTSAQFVGYLRGDDVAAAYASADVLVFPSLSETFGLAPLEAMACGLPVIATTAGGLVDTIRDGINALVYDPATPHAITMRLEQFRDDPALRRRLREGALAHARGRDWQATMDQLIGFYQLARRMHRWRRHLRGRRRTIMPR